jgi:hypothetical protein
MRKRKEVGTMNTWHDYIQNAEMEIYQGKSAKGLRRMATIIKRQNKEKATAYYYMARRIDFAPKHNGKYCKTWVIFGNCPPWLHS